MRSRLGFLRQSSLPATPRPFFGYLLLIFGADPTEVGLGTGHVGSQVEDIDAGESRIVVGPVKNLTGLIRSESLPAGIDVVDGRAITSGDLSIIRRDGQGRWLIFRIHGGQIMTI